MGQEWVSASVLPLFSRLVEESVGVRDLASLMLNDTSFRCREDHVLAALVPEFKPLIDRFYAKRGPPMAKTFRPEFIQNADASLVKRIPQLVATWDEVRRQVYLADGSTSKAVATFRELLETVRLFDLTGQRLSQMEP